MGKDSISYPAIQDPVLFDRVVAEAAGALVSGLPWLDKAFGRARTVLRPESGRTSRIPAVYSGDGVPGRADEYESLLPDSGHGCYCFFIVMDPQEVSQMAGGQASLTAGYAVIFWLDLRRISGRAEWRDTERVKAQALSLLRNGLGLRTGRLTVERIYEEGRNIFREYSIDEVDNQYLIHPYAGFRFEGTITAREGCSI